LPNRGPSFRSWHSSSLALAWHSAAGLGNHHWPQVQAYGRCRLRTRFLAVRTLDVRHGWRHSSTNGRPLSAGRCSLLNLPCARVSSRARLGLRHTSTSRTGSRTGWVHSNGRGRHTSPCRLRNNGRVRHTRRVVRSSGWDRRFSATFRRRRHGTLAPACQQAPSSVLHLGSPRAHHREWDPIRRPERGLPLLHKRQHGTQRQHALRQHALRQHGARLPLLSSRLSLLTAARRLRPRRQQALDSASPLA